MKTIYQVSVRNASLDFKSHKRSSPKSEQIFKELYSYCSKETALSRVMLETINQENFANWAMEKYDHMAPFVYLTNKLNSSMENRL